MKLKLLSYFAFLGMAYPALADLTIPKSVEPFFEKYCYNCHDADTEKGDFNLEDFSRKISNAVDAEHWQNLIDQMNAGEMPPKKKKQPSKAELSAAIGDLTEILFKAQDVLKDSGGKAALRKLNRREYEATVKRLTGLRFIAEKLPSDPSGRFDTIGQNQSLSALQLKNYYAVAQELSETALYWATQPRHESKVIKKPYVSKTKYTLQAKKAYEDVKAYERIQKEGISPQEVGLDPKTWKKLNSKVGKRVLAVLKRDASYYERHKDFYEKATVLTGTREKPSARGSSFTYDPRAHHRITVSAALVDGSKTKLRRLLGAFPSFQSIRQEGNLGNALDSFIVTGTYEKPSRHSFILNSHYRTGQKKVKEETVLFAEDVKTGNNLRLQHLKFMEPDAPADTVMVHGVEIEGPFYNPQSPLEKLAEKYKLGKGKGADFDKLVEKFLTEFTDVAFRYRGIPEGFIERLVNYYQLRRKEKLPAVKALVDPLAMVFTSTRFLYLSEPKNKTTKALDPLSLANRLSYFIWSQPADKELYDLAQSGELLQAAVLNQQIDRMLADPKADAFFKGFMSQWLHLKRYDEVSLSEKYNLMRSDGMIHASKKEPIEFFKTLVRENLSSSNLIDSDFVTINGQLAIKYGLTKHYSGDGFQKVKLPQDSARGGILTQSAFLTAGTMGNRPSPIIRGAMVKEILLNDPPPPPPPNVPELVQAGVDPLASVRSLVDLHQKRAQCASCHARFDFIGLGLENFDAVGLWRDKELVSNEVDLIKALENNAKKSKIYDIDPSSELPTGETFGSVQELKKALMKHDDKVAWSVFEGLLCYALGRDASFTDRPFIEQSLKELAQTGKGEKYAVKDMIKQIVTSKMFLEN